MSLLGSANNSVNLVKAALDAKMAIASADEKEKLADAKLALADLKQLIADLKEKILSLQDSLKIKNEFRTEQGVQWKTNDSGKVQPFCPVCYSNDKIVPLQKAYDGERKENTRWICPDTTCGANYNPWEYKEPEQSPPQWQGFI
ncbi:MAG: hypothetical protein ABI221_02425 [Candidatus Saccharimonadales bacterium]